MSKPEKRIKVNRLLTGTPAGGYINLKRGNKYQAKLLKSGVAQTQREAAILSYTRTLAWQFIATELLATLGGTSMVWLQKYLNKKEQKRLASLPNTEIGDKPYDFRDHLQYTSEEVLDY